MCNCRQQLVGKLKVIFIMVQHNSVKEPNYYNSIAERPNNITINKVRKQKARKQKAEQLFLLA
jgi:hypothetical protein